MLVLQKTPGDKEKKDHAKKLKQQGNRLAALETELAALEKRCAHYANSIARCYTTRWRGSRSRL